MSFLATKRKIGLFYFRLCKKKKKGKSEESGKILRSVVPAEICNGKHRYIDIYFLFGCFFPCCCARFCDFFVRHQCGFKITCGITAIKMSSLCLNWPLGFFG